MCLSFFVLQVCLPFLLFCLGIDPKTDVATLVSQVVQDFSASPQTTSPVQTKGDACGCLTPHQLFILLSNPATLQCKILDTSSGPYSIIPSQTLLSTGCHAFLQLIGTGLYFEKSLVKTSKFLIIRPLLRFMCL